MNVIQKHIDLFYMFLNAFGMVIPTTAELDKYGKDMGKYEPDRDGVSYLEIPRALADCLITVLVLKMEIAKFLKEQLKENLRNVKSELDKKSTMSPKRVIAHLLKHPDPPEEMKDRMSRLILLEELVWKSYRQILLDSGVTKSLQIAVGIRKTLSDEFIILELPADANEENEPDTDESREGHHLAEIIGETLEQLLGEDNEKDETIEGTKPSLTKEEPPPKPISLEDLKRNLGMGEGSVDDPIIPSSPKPS
jgi:hypothetical protein